MITTLPYHEVINVTLQLLVLQQYCIRVKVIWPGMNSYQEGKNCVCTTHLNGWLYLQWYRANYYSERAVFMCVIAVMLMWKFERKVVFFSPYWKCFERLNTNRQNISLHKNMFSIWKLLNWSFFNMFWLLDLSSALKLLEMFASSKTKTKTFANYFFSRISTSIFLLAIFGEVMMISSPCWFGLEYSKDHGISRTK